MKPTQINTNPEVNIVDCTDNKSKASYSVLNAKFPEAASYEIRKYKRAIPTASLKSPNIEIILEKLSSTFFGDTSSKKVDIIYVNYRADQLPLPQTDTIGTELTIKTKTNAIS